ncbi:hypothetical protein Tco_1496243 [Tanacetum coccineum]
MYLRFLQLFLNNQIKNLAEVFNDEYVAPSQTKKVFANMRREGKGFSGKITPLFPSMLVTQAVEGEDETIHKERGDSVERAATTAASLDAVQDSGSGPRRQDTILGDIHAQTRFVRLSKQSHNPPLSRVNTLRSGEDRMQLQELMKIYTKLSDRTRVKKLEKKKKSRTPQLKRRLFKVRIKSSVEKSLGAQEDASKQGRNEIDQDEGTSFVQEDAETQGRYGHDIDVTTTSASITTAGVSVSTAEPMRSQKRNQKKNQRKKAVSSEVATRPTRGVVMREVSEAASRPIVPPQQQLDLKDKGKGIIQEPEKPVKVKGKDQIAVDEEFARKLEAQLQAELEGEERMRRQKEEEDNLISWDNTQAMMEANSELVQRLQAEEQGEITIEERLKLFVELMNRRK